MISSQGFWSYVHNDDHVEGGRIIRLARDVVGQYRMLTGEDIRLFLDTDDLEWGDQWRKVIDSNLSSVAFFIPVMTPRYFMSPECRRELSFFLRQTSDLGLKELLLPLHYVNVPALYNENTEDELIKLLGTFQWEDWRELRFSDVTSEEYRRGVAKLAEKLVEANKRAEVIAVSVPEQIDEVHIDSEDSSPGFIDTLADSEEKLTKLPETLKTLTQDMLQIGQIMSKATDDVQRGDAQGKGFAARLIVARQTATRLSEPIERIYSLSNVYASQLHSIDSGFHIIIEQAPIEIKDNPEVKQKYCTFFDTIRQMAEASNTAIDSTQRMLNAAEPLERASRDLRPVFRRLKQGLVVLLESSKVTSEWLDLIDATGLVCKDSTNQTKGADS